MRQGLSLGPAPRASARSARATTPGNSGNNLRSGLCRHWLRQISPRKGRAMNVTAARRRRAAAPTPWRFFFTIPWTLAVCHYGVHHFAPTHGACGGHLYFVFFQFGAGTAVPRRIPRIPKIQHFPESESSWGGVPALASDPEVTRRFLVTFAS